MHCPPRFTLHPLRRAARVLALAVPLGITGLVAPLGLAQAAPPAQEYRIEAGSLATVVSTFAAQSGVLLSAPAQGLEGRRSPGLQGRYTPGEGFQQILQGSGLQAVRQADGSYRLESVAATGVTSLNDTTVTGFALGNALGETDGYLATHSNVATKTSKGLLETSQSVSVVTREQIDEQGAKTVQQAMRYTPGIFTGQIGASNRYDYVVMRGFADNSVDNVFLDGLKTMGDSGTFSSLQVDPYFLERIDVVKGPASVLYGRSLPGGLVALTSKKPLYQPYHQVQAMLGNLGQRGAGFDFGGPLDEEGRIAYRLVGLAQHSDTQFNHVEEERYALAPSLAIDLSDDTTLTLQAYLQKDPDGGYHSGVPAEGSLYRRNGRYISNHFF
ncbi:MAG TPA: TonB-dependent siderophore receptor, partial [Pseudomonas sp.]|nr:TonB-dependent siderophore receptor [Pseudomonas sp.]